MLPVNPLPRESHGNPSDTQVSISPVLVSQNSQINPAPHIPARLASSQQKPAWDPEGAAESSRQQEPWTEVQRGDLNPAFAMCLPFRASVSSSETGRRACCPRGCWENETRPPPPEGTLHVPSGLSPRFHRFPPDSRSAPRPAKSLGPRLSQAPTLGWGSRRRPGSPGLIEKKSLPGAVNSGISDTCDLGPLSPIVPHPSTSAQGRGPRQEAGL